MSIVSKLFVMIACTFTDMLLYILSIAGTEMVHFIVLSIALGVATANIDLLAHVLAF